MIRMLIAAPSSGSGKTVVTCALLTALRRRGYEPCAFKCGPDYIDPMFHRAVLDVPCHNLDLFFTGEEQLRRDFARSSAGHGAAVCEAAMGYYDGVGGGRRASAWDVARTLDLPVVLVLRPGYDPGKLPREERIAGVLLNDGAEPPEDLPVLGRLPHLPEAEIPSRHLGLYTAAEIGDLRRRFARLAEALETNTDLDRLLALCDRKPVKIAVARDEAFCFTYAETLETLELCGAEPVFFSPLRDRALPPGVCGVYLPGGYPELYAAALSENVSMRKAVAAALRNGMPAVAECGGFLYLGKTLRDAEGKAWPMAGVLPGEGYPTGKLVRFGYAELTAETDSLLFRAGERFPAHEFHHWDSTEPGEALAAKKPVGDRAWRCGVVSDSLYAGFPHLYFAGNPVLARRFTEAAERYRRKEGSWKNC